MFVLLIVVGFCLKTMLLEIQLTGWQVMFVFCSYDTKENISNSLCDNFHILNGRVFICTLSALFVDPFFNIRQAISPLSYLCPLLSCISYLCYNCSVIYQKTYIIDTHVIGRHI